MGKSQLATGVVGITFPRTRSLWTPVLSGLR